MLLDAVLPVLKPLIMPIIIIVAAAIIAFVSNSWSISITAVAVAVFLIVLQRVRPSNIVLIARTVTFAHEYLKNRYANKLETEERLLIASGIVVTSIHLSENRLAIDDIFKALEYAKKRQVGLLGRHISIYDVDLRDLSSTRHATNRELEKKNDLLLDFTLNIEALEFLAGGITARMSAVDVLSAVYDNKEVIYWAIEKTRKKIRARIPDGIIERADRLMASKDMSAVRTKLNDAAVQAD